MIKDINEVKLKVMEALQEEAYKGIVRVDSETMHVIGVRPGDIIEIEGQRKTVGIVDRAYPTDVGQQVIRMDGIIRRNAKTSIGEIIIIRKANVLEAKSITIAPSQQGIVIQASPELFRRGLLGRAVVKGDIISLGGARRRRRTMEDSPFEEIFNVFEEGFMGSFGLPSLKFVVVDSNPKQAVIVSEITIINVTQKAVEVSDEKIPEVNYEDLGGLDEEIKKIREMVELPLKHPEIFTRLGIEPPSGVLLHGPPGSGKTLLAKAVANESEANFMLINGPEIMNKFYGESEKRIRDIFEEAEKNAPSIIFIDEIDAIAPKREETRGEVERRVVAQLLCLHPSTPVYLKDGIKTIKNLFNETEGETFTENGVTFKTPNNEIYAQGLSVLGKVNNNRIITLTKTNAPKAFKINLNNGNEIISSEITKFLAIDDNGINWKNASELNAFDYILIPRKLENSDEIQKISIFDLKEKNKWVLKLKEDSSLYRLLNKKYILLSDLINLRDSNKLNESTTRNKILNLLLNKKELSKTEIEKELKITRKSLNNYIKPLIKSKVIEISKDKLQLILHLDNLDHEIISIARKENKEVYPIKENYFVTIPKILDEDLAKFLGLLISDGNLTNNRVNIYGETTPIAYDIAKMLFNKNISISKNNQRMDIYSKPLSYFINEYFGVPIGKKSFTVKVPDKIYKSPVSVKSAFLAGLLEGDGTIKESIIFSTKSKELALGISRLLLQLGITSKISNYNCYQVKINGGFESFQRFSNNILPYMKLNRKKENLMKFTNRIKKVSTIIYPVKSFLKEIRDKNKIRIDDSMYRYLSPNLPYQINSNVLGYFVQEFGNIESQFIQELKQVYTSDVIPCQITQVEQIVGGEMYDLTTENSNFFAGNTPIVVHNTMMDGLKSRKNVIVIAATNRPNAVDPALRRPGRFDREISINVPDKNGRLEILKIHSRNMPIEHWDNLSAAKITKKRIMNFPQEAEKKIAEKNSKISEMNIEIKQLNTEITKKIAEKNSKISEMNIEIKQLNDDIDKIKLEVKRLEQQKTIVAESQFRKIVQLLSFKKDELMGQEDLLKTKVRESKNLQEKIIAFEEETKDKINKSKQKISDYSKEIENLEIDKGEIKNIVIPKVNRSKEILDKILKRLENVKHAKDLVEPNDSRNKFATRELKEKEIMQIIEPLLTSGIVSDNLLDEIRKDSKLELLHYFAEKTHGFVGADLSALTKYLAMNVFRKILPVLNLNEKEPISEDVLQKQRVPSEEFNDGLKMVRPSALREVSIEKPNVNWKDIGGLEELKQELKEAVEWPLKHKDAFKRLGIRPPRGILMYGPPGTGKTLLAKAVANESEANFINIKGPSLLNMWVGESEKGIRQIFEKARQVAPTIIFFDEIDSIAVRRGLSAGTKVTERMLNTLLAEMDGLQELNDVVVIGATNRPDIIDPALLRPGRFDRIISTQMPGKGSRLEIFNIHTQLMKDVLSVDVNLNKLVDLTENYSGADIEAVCREAAMLSLRESIKAKEIRMDHFLQALQKTGPSLSIDDRKRYQEIEEELKMARNTQAKQEIPSYLG